MSIGFRKILRDLWRSKGRTLLAVLSIFIGVFAVGTISGMNDLMPARMLGSYSATNPAPIVILLNGGVTDDDITSLSRVPGVLGIEGSSSQDEQWRLTPNMPWRIASFVMRKYEQQKFNTIELLSGVWPTKDTVAVDITAVESLGLPARGTITVKINDRERELTVAGVVRDLAIRSPAFGGNAMLYISQDMANKILGWGRYGVLRVQIPAFSQQEAEAAVGRLKLQLEKMGVSIFYYQVTSPDKHPAQDTINGIMLILSVMAILSLGLGLLLVINTVNAIVAQQVPQIGVIKAVGGSTRQLLTLYLSGVLAYGLIALLLAVPLAALAANALTAAMLKVMAIPADPMFRISQQAIRQQAIIALLVPVLAALWPIFSGVRITVRQAISSYGIGGGFGKSLLDRLLSRLRFLPRTVSLTIRNTFRRKGRVVLTEITLVLAGVIFIMVMSSAASFTYTINYLIDNLGLRVLINFQQPVRIDELLPVINAQLNIDQVEMQLFQASSAFLNKDDEKGEDVFVYAVRPESTLLKLPVVAGRWLLPEDGHAVVLNRNRADQLGVTVGDKVWLSLEDTQHKSEWTVVGTVFDLSGMQRTAYVSLPVYQRDMGLVGRSTSAWLTTTPDNAATQLQVEQQLRIR
jgi:putative ABC transport system permease protein